MSETGRGGGEEEREVHEKETREKIGDYLGAYFDRIKERVLYAKDDDPRGKQYQDELQMMYIIVDGVRDIGLADRMIDANILRIALSGLKKAFVVDKLGVDLSDEAKFLSILASLKTLSE